MRYNHLKFDFYYFNKDKVFNFQSRDSMLFLSIVILTCVKLRLFARLALNKSACFNYSNPVLVIPHSFKLTIFKLLLN